MARHAFKQAEGDSASAWVRIMENCASELRTRIIQGRSVTIELPVPLFVLPKRAGVDALSFLIMPGTCNTECGHWPTFLGTKLVAILQGQPVENTEVTSAELWGRRRSSLDLTSAEGIQKLTETGYGIRTLGGFRCMSLILRKATRSAWRWRRR